MPAFGKSSLPSSRTPPWPADALSDIAVSPTTPAPTIAVAAITAYTRVLLIIGLLLLSRAVAV
jgi:hypothetical protein